MADNDDIVQNVRVNVEADDSGSNSAFDQLRESLLSAFEAIKQAFSSFDFGDLWEKLKASGAKALEALRSIVGDSFKSMAESALANAEVIGTAVLAIGAAVAGLAAALGIAAKAMYGFVQSTSQAVNAMGELADRTQTAISTVSALQSFFAQAGVGPKEFESVYRHLGSTIAETWSSIKKEVTEGSDKVAQTHLAAQQAALRLQDAQRSLKETGADLAKQQRDDANSVADAQRSLAEAEIAKSKSLGVDTSAREETLKNQKLDTDVARAKQAVADAQDKQDRDISKAQEERVKRTLALRQAELADDQARKASRTADRNDLGNITKSVQDLAGGNVEALRNFNATADNILKGIVSSAAQSGAAIKGLGVDFSGLSDTGPKVKDVLLQLGLVLNNINDPILRNQVAFKALGGASQDFISALKTGGIDEFIQKMGELGGAVSEADKKIASDFNNSLTRLQDTLGNIGVKVSTAFGPSFTKALDSLNDAFDRSRDNIVRFANSISGIVGPPVELFAKSINFIAQTVNTLIDIFRNLRDAISAAFRFDGSAFLKSLENLYNILKAIVKIITGDLKGGIEDLKRQSAKELADSFKKKDETNTTEPTRTGTSASSAGPTEVERRRREDLSINRPRDSEGFVVGTQLTQAERDRVNFLAKQNEDAAARERGFDPNPPTTLQRAGQLLDPRPLTSKVGELLDPRPLLERLFGPSQAQPPVPTPQLQQQPGAPAQPATSSSVLETLQGIGQKLQQNIDSHFGGQPDSQTQPGAQQPSVLDSVLDKLGGFLNKQEPPNNPEDPVNGLGIRGDAEQAAEGLQKVATATDAPVAPLQQLATAASEAAAQLASVKAVKTDAGGNSTTIAAAGGGHVRGPGTSTSDSIDARLSDNEYVLQSSAVNAVGVPFLNWLNRLRGFASGGPVNNHPLVGDTNANSPTLGPGQHSILYDPMTGGAYIDGILRVPPDPILNDPTVRQAIEESKKGMQEQQQTKKKGSDFTGIFGGHVFGESGSFAGGGPVWGPGTATSDSILARVSNGEFVQPERATRHYGLAFMEAIRNLSLPRMPQFALGGLVSPRMPRFAAGGPVEVGTVSPALPHLGSLDLTTDYGVARVYGDRDTIGDLRKAAINKNIGSQRKSGWMG